MTQPTPGGDQQPPADQQQRPTRKPRTLDVVEFPHHDVLLGRTHTARGVVLRLAEGEPATVQPLAGHTVQVDPAELIPLTAADLD